MRQTLVLRRIVAAAALAAASSAGAQTLHHNVSTQDYNVLNFPAPIKKAVLPPHAPLDGKPYYLSGNKTLLLRFKADATNPVQLVVELSDGTVDTLYLTPDTKIGAQTITLAASLPLGAVGSPGSNPNARYIPALSSIVQGSIPAGYSKDSALPKPLRYDRLTATPITSWSDPAQGAHIIAYKLHAVSGKASVVDPSQFYLPGVRAVLSTGARVDAKHAPTLYIVEVN